MPADRKAGPGQRKRAAGGKPSPQLERAESIVDDLTERIRRFAGQTASRAREEAEDIWAEAKETRRGWRAAKP